MQPQDMFCCNTACPSVGQSGRGNLIWHHQSKGRLKCKVCSKTFSVHKGTPLFGLRKCRSLFIVIITLLAYGCPVQAIVKAFGLDTRTVYALLARAGQHCQEIHRHLVEQGRPQGQIQADEIYARRQSGKAWVAMALAVPTRLWLGASVGLQRNTQLIYTLAQIIARCSDPQKSLLIVTDGLKTYIGALQRACCHSIRNGKLGRPRKKVWPKLLIVQGVKSYALHGKRYYCKGLHHCRIALGNLQHIGQVLKQTQSTELLQTAYIERLNASFRKAIACLGRKNRRLLWKTQTLEQWVYLRGCAYNFCQMHKSLSARKSQSPAMAAGITQHIWSFNELLNYKVRPPLWEPPVKQGRHPKIIKELIQIWRPDLATR